MSTVSQGRELGLRAAKDRVVGAPLRVGAKGHLRARATDWALEVPAGDSRTRRRPRAHLSTRDKGDTTYPHARETLGRRPRWRSAPETPPSLAPPNRVVDEFCRVGCRE